MNEIGVLLGSNLQVVHAVPGRVRLRTANGKPIAALETLAQHLRHQKGVSEVQTNPTTKSSVISFDTNVLTLPQMLELLQQYGVSEASENTASLQETNPLEISWKSAKSIVPLIAGMAVTGGLGLEGFIAFPVFAIAETLTRQLMNQFESETAAEKQDSADILVLEPQNNGKLAETNNKSLTEEVEYRLVHAIPGRIRFQVPRITKDPEYTYRLAVLIESDARVTNVRVNATAGSIAISYDSSLVADDEMRSHLISLIQSASNIILLPNLKPASIQSETENEAESNPWSNITLPAICTVLSLLGGPLGLPIPPAIIGGAIAITALPVAQRALESILQEQRLNIDFLDFAAIAITTLQGQFINPALMLLLIEIGEAIREQTARSSKKQTLDLLDSLKQLVWVERNGEKQEISIHEVRQGDTVIVYPGELIPVDGHIIRGKALIDEQKLTGEAMPVMRKKGQAVYASTLVREGQLYILAEKVGVDTRAGQIIKVMQDAPVHDTRIENYAAKVADSAVVPTLLLSGIVFAATRNLARAASVLTLDFATGIRVSVPTTVLAALTHAARRGILIRSGRALEKLAAVDAVVFDKTGTLTKGEPVVVCVETTSELISPLQVLEFAAAAEQRLTHPVAEAVMRYAQEKGARVLPRGKWNYEIGLGVRAEIDGKIVLVGSDRFIQQEGITLDKLHEKHPNLQAPGNSSIYVVCNGELLGALAYRDPLRAESPQVLKVLRTAEKMEIHILTGDNKRTASAVAKELGIPTEYTHAEAFPEQKVAVVKGLHEEGKTVAFVGDGINDSPALAYADVSVSFGNGSDVARETADVVLMENNLQGLPEAIAIARQAMQLIHQNTGIVAIPNLSALILAATIGIPPLAATAVNNGSAIIAGLNGLRPLLGTSEDADLAIANTDTPGKEQDSSNWQTSSQITNGNGKHHSLVEVEALIPVSGNSLSTLTEVSNNVVRDIPYAIDTEVYPVEVTSAREIDLEFESLTGRTLARRLNVSSSTISKRKSDSDFSEWTRSKDPEGIPWKYSDKTKQFVPALQLV